MLAGFVRCNGGLDNGTALSSFASRRGQNEHRHSGITAGELNEFVEGH
jgi:hypothetical protein